MKKLMLICLMILVAGCVSARWDTETLEVFSVGANKEISGLNITQNSDGSFTISLESSKIEGQDSFIALMEKVYDLGVGAGSAGSIP